MSRLKAVIVALIILAPSCVAIYQAQAATLLVTVDPNTYSGSGNVIDSTSGLVGTPSNVTYLSGTNCGVFSFSANGNIAFPQTNFGTQFSISAWVKPNTSGSDIQTLISNAGAGQSANGFKAFWNNWSTSDLKMILENGNGTSGDATVSSSAVVTNSQWQHLVYTFNTSTRAVTMYRNGVAVNTNGNLLVSPAPNTNQQWWLGTLGGYYYNLYGELGVVKIYSTVLTQAEVTTDYNSTSARYAATPTCPVPAAPINSSVPTVSGTTAFNSVLTAANGTWSSNPTGYTYQWSRASTAGGTYTSISGATAQTYTLATADIGNYIKVSVTATNAGGSASALSAATSQISKATQSSLTASLSVNSKTYPYSQAITISTSGGSGTGATTYAVSNGTATSCALSDSSSTPTLTAASNGTCLITATKASDNNYLSVSSSAQIFTFNRATPGTLTITTLSVTYAETLTLLTNGGQSSAIDTFTVNSGPCTISGSTLTPTAIGICYVTAYRAADSSFSATNSISTAISISKARPVMSFTISRAPVYRASSEISASVSTAGTLKFLVNGKAIPGCQSKVANAGNGYVAVCNWKPSARNYVNLIITFSPTNSNYFAGRIDGPTYLVAPRVGTR